MISWNQQTVYECVTFHTTTLFRCFDFVQGIHIWYAHSLHVSIKHCENKHATISHFQCTQHKQKLRTHAMLASIHWTRKMNSKNENQNEAKIKLDAGIEREGEGERGPLKPDEQMKIQHAAIHAVVWSLTHIVDAPGKREISTRSMSSCECVRVYFGEFKRKKKK